jgi:hypothetical protein
VEQPRRNEPRFYRYPIGRVVAVIDDSEELEAVLGDLEEAGVDVTSVNVLSGSDGARLLDRTGAAHGVRARLLRLLQQSAPERELIADHYRALAQGRHVVYVPVRGDDQRDRVVDIFRDHDGSGILHFHRWTIEHFPN